MSDNKTILVVDDIRVNTILLKMMLNTTPYNVISAESGATALEILKDNHVDLVLLDLMMPVMNGFEVLKAIRDNSSTDYSKVPVIITTALSDNTSMESAKELGATGYLVKPIDRPSLIEVVDKYLN